MGTFLLLLGVNFLPLSHSVHDVGKPGREEVAKVDGRLRLWVRESQSSSGPGVESSVVREEGQGEVGTGTATVVTCAVPCLWEEVKLFALQFALRGNFLDWEQLTAIPATSGPVAPFGAGYPVHHLPGRHEAVDSVVLLQRARKLVRVPDAGVAHQPLLDVGQGLLRNER